MLVHQILVLAVGTFMLRGVQAEAFNCQPQNALYTTLCKYRLEIIRRNNIANIRTQIVALIDSVDGPTTVNKVICANMQIVDFDKIMLDIEPRLRLCIATKLRAVGYLTPLCPHLAVIDKNFGQNMQCGGGLLGGLLCLVGNLLGLVGALLGGLLEVLGVSLANKLEEPVEELVNIAQECYETIKADIDRLAKEVLAEMQKCVA